MLTNTYINFDQNVNTPHSHHLFPFGDSFAVPKFFLTFIMASE